MVETQSEIHIPAGVLIPCQLITTVESSTIKTPVVGVVEIDVCHVTVATGGPTL